MTHDSIAPPFTGARHTTKRRKKFTLTEAEDFGIRCYTGRDTRDYARHTITIRPDWTFDTPHDLAAERIAAAFGGWCSCLELEAAIEAARLTMAYQLRYRHYPITREKSGQWIVRGTNTAKPHRFDSVITAASYARSPQHAADEYRAPVHLVHRMVEIFAWFRGDVAAPPLDDSCRDLIHDQDALNQLWDAGIHPDQLPKLHHRAGADRPLAAATYMALAYCSVRPDQLPLLIDVAGDLETALAHLGPGIRRPEQLAQRLQQLRGDQR